MSRTVSDPLDALDARIAILDRGGTIRRTNRAWDEFGAENGAGSVDWVGTDYLDAIATGGDRKAARAKSGIERVLDGARETFELVYPCHGPGVERWFQLHASRYGDDGDLRVLVEHTDVTERERAAIRRAEQLRRERERLEHLLDRINGLLRDVMAVLIEGRTRDEMEQGVCERLAATDGYGSAWISDVDLREETVSPRTWAGDVAFDDDASDIPLDGDGASGPCADAIRSRETQVVGAPVEEALTAAHAAAVDLDGGSGSLLSVPLAYGDAVFGALTVYATDDCAFDQYERPILEVLSAAVADAINELESERILQTSRVVELEFEIRDSEFRWCELAAAGECRLTYSGSSYRSDGRPRLLYAAETETPDTVVSAAEDRDDVRTAQCVTDGATEKLFEFVVEDSLVATLADYGGVTREVEVDGERARVALDLPNEATARSMFDLVDERFSNVRLVGYRERERSVDTVHGFAATVADRLTERQLAALRLAYFSRFFEWPRPTSGDELAESMDVARPTFHQHLRAAERKVFEELFEGLGRDPN